MFVNRPPFLSRAQSGQPIVLFAPLAYRLEMESLQIMKSGSIIRTEIHHEESLTEDRHFRACIRQSVVDVLAETAMRSHCRPAGRAKPNVIIYSDQRGQEKYADPPIDLRCQHCIRMTELGSGADVGRALICTLDELAVVSDAVVEAWQPGGAATRTRRRTGQDHTWSARTLLFRRLGAACQ
jgi:hypothetical protein